LYSFYHNCKQHKPQKNCLYNNPSIYYLFPPNLKSVQGWEPDWGLGADAKYCIYSEFVGGSCVFDVRTYWSLPFFLAFKTREDAKMFLKTNIKEIKLAKDFI
jgi:hypothetical protein